MGVSFTLAVRTRGALYPNFFLVTPHSNLSYSCIGVQSAGKESCHRLLRIWLISSNEQLSAVWHCGGARARAQWGGHRRGAKGSRNCSATGHLLIARLGDRADRVFILIYYILYIYIRVYTLIILIKLSYMKTSCYEWTTSCLPPAYYS